MKRTRLRSASIILPILSSSFLLSPVNGGEANGTQVVVDTRRRRRRRRAIENTSFGFDNVFVRPLGCNEANNDACRHQLDPLQDNVSGKDDPYPTMAPSIYPSMIPTPIPSIEPSVGPSADPTLASDPTFAPTIDPTTQPTVSPTTGPTVPPSSPPSSTAAPTRTAHPTETRQPTVGPTMSPLPTQTRQPTGSHPPTDTPTLTRSPTVTARPTITPQPTIVPTASPQPTISPQPTATRFPTKFPSISLKPTITAGPTTTPQPSDLPTAPPQPSISHEPTATRSPTNSPTTSQAPTITAMPTMTIQPSNLPTASPQPTTSHQPTTTGLPTNSPTLTPTPTVTAGPTTTYGPSNLPTASPLPTITASPSVNSQFLQLLECTIDSDGNFGTTDIPSASVEFLYQVEVQSDVTDTETEESIAPKVEEAVANMLLPELLSDQCSATARSVSARQGTPTTGGGDNATSTLSGLSTQPSDLVLSGVPCEGNVSESCYIIDGRMTIYRDDDPASLTNFTKNLVFESMQNGDFDSSVDDRIISVRYVNGTAIDKRSIDGSQGQNDDDGFVQSTIPLFAWLLIAAASTLFIVCCGICLFCCRRRRNRDDDENGPGAGGGGNEGSSFFRRGEYSALGMSRDHVSSLSDDGAVQHLPPFPDSGFGSSDGSFSGGAMGHLRSLSSGSSS